MVVFAGGAGVLRESDDRGLGVDMGNLVWRRVVEQGIFDDVDENL